MKNKLHEKFDFGKANEKQIEAIKMTEGKILINAGPGTGKTFTLVKKVAYLIHEKNIKPEEIFVATFTEKAAKELVSRISNELEININDMYIGTFHSICLRIIEENIDSSNHRKNYQVLDDFDQEFFIYKNIKAFQEIENLDEIFLKICPFRSPILIQKVKGSDKFIYKQASKQEIKDSLPQDYLWEYARTIRKITDTIREKMISSQEIINDENQDIKLFAKILKTYEDLLIKNNLFDFSSIQTEALSLLLKNKDILKKLQDKIKYIMVDEYQDTNPAQNKIIKLIGEKCKNICVVGDDDQGLYRFRGASIKNIFSFRKDAQSQITLTKNYRSTPQIVEIYNSWIKNPNKFLWENCRINKKIQPVRENQPYQSTMKISAKSTKDWIYKIYNFIKQLEEKGKITNYNQIAFLFSSLKSPEVSKLQKYLEKNGINVYSPRSGQYFTRMEIQLLIGILIYIFDDYRKNLVNRNYNQIRSRQIEFYYTHCLEKARDFISQENKKDLKDEIEKIKEEINQNKEKLSYTKIIYQILSYSNYNATLSIKLTSSIYKQRSVRNLAKFTQIIKKFETLYKAQNITNENTEKLLNEYLFFLYPNKIGEYEDESEYAPKDCVSFLTIHQSKGMEFPVVFVCSLDKGPFENTDPVTETLTKIEIKYLPKDRFEQRADIKYYDFWRKYYTAFSRAQDILILTCHQLPKSEFSMIYNHREIKEFKENMINKKMQLSKIKDINIKNSYAFTSDINLYQSCPRKYKFFKELGFAQSETNKMFFGSLVHQNIEDINKASQKDKKITEEKIKQNFEKNYEIFSEKTGETLTKEQKSEAIKQIQTYYKKNKDKLKDIISAEQEINLVKDKYIMTGKIDLLKKLDDSIEIVDFKTGKKPQKESMELKIYEKQLTIYAHMIMQNTKQDVKQLKLYYTQENQPEIIFPLDKQKMEKYVKEFDQTVAKIQNKEFEKKTNNKTICKTCEFQTYCIQKEKREKEKIKHKAEKEVTSEK